MLSIEQLLNIKKQQHANHDVQPPKPLHGATAEYKKYLATCKFKLVVYYNQNKSGVYFSQYDKDANKNRRHIPSVDFVLSAGGFMVQNHEVGFLKLVDYVVQNATKIDKALLILNDYISYTEQMIIKFDTKNFALSQYVNPVFVDDGKGNRFFKRLDGEPFRIDKMREQFTK